MIQRRGYTVGGQVQGVGFRPFVFRTAERLGLSGFVGNTSDGVRIEVQGETSALDAFDRALVADLPVLARIVSCVREELAVVSVLAAVSGLAKDTAQAEPPFRIVASHGHHGHAVLVSPDVATCAHCLADMADPTNRRYQYPFTNCTDCGPRYTITRSIPYDRPCTSMGCFPLCPSCQAEYDNPRDRRFHAQPNACPVCGPRLWLTDGMCADAGAAGATCGQTAEPYAILEQTASALAAGKIVAIKGLGGFHLVCDATSAATVATLRQRKHRPHKALAVMVADSDTVRRVAVCLPQEEAILSSPEHPIVILPARPGVLPRVIAPDLDSVGIMLPYTPLHQLLLQAFRQHRALPALVMTSGNAGGEPIALGNREALVRLQGIADLFLLHNRDILIRADDSVVCVLPQGADAATDVSGYPKAAGQQEAAATTPRTEPPRLHVFRRARGYVPRPLSLPQPSDSPAANALPCILATGAELKNTLCLTRGHDAFVSQHIGDLKNLETYSFFRDMATHLSALLEVRPAAVVCDLHPDYLSTAYALELGASMPVLRIQHHFAHSYSVLGEHGHLGPALCLALDGTGYGLDGTIWGGELLLVQPDAVRPAGGAVPASVEHPLLGELSLMPGQAATPWGVRLGRLAPFPLPGGEAAIREPWRLASGFLALPELALALSQREHEALVRSFFGSEEVPPHVLRTHAAIGEMVRHRATPRTSSCGRLFDAVSALLGLCPVISYEGQAAIRLEHAASTAPAEAYPAKLAKLAALPVALAPCGALWELDTTALFLHLLEAKRAGVAVPVLARRFHLGLAEGLAELALRGAVQSGVRTVALSGGVLHNRILAEALPAALLRRGLVPLTHRVLPPGDGGLAYGQAFWASLLLARH